MDARFDGVIFGGQAKSIPADGEQNVVALHAPLTGDDIHGGVRPGMAHVQPLPGRVGELQQPVKLGLGVVFTGVEGLLLVPLLLPFRLYDLRIVSLCHNLSSFVYML